MAKPSVWKDHTSNCTMETEWDSKRRDHWKVSLLMFVVVKLTAEKVARNQDEESMKLERYKI